MHTKKILFLLAVCLSCTLGLHDVEASGRKEVFAQKDSLKVEYPDWQQEDKTGYIQYYGISMKLSELRDRLGKYPELDILLDIRPDMHLVSSDVSALHGDDIKSKAGDVLYFVPDVDHIPGKLSDIQQIVITLEDLKKHTDLDVGGFVEAEIPIPEFKLASYPKAQLFIKTAVDCELRGLGIFPSLPYTPILVYGAKPPVPDVVEDEEYEPSGGGVLAYGTAAPGLEEYSDVEHQDPYPVDEKEKREGDRPHEAGSGRAQGPRDPHQYGAHEVKTSWDGDVALYSSEEEDRPQPARFIEAGSKPLSFRLAIGLSVLSGLLLILSIVQVWFYAQKGEAKPAAAEPSTESPEVKVEAENVVPPATGNRTRRSRR